MTTNPTPIPEPTSRTALVVGKRDGETVVALRMDNDDIPWAATLPGLEPFTWYSWPILHPVAPHRRRAPDAPPASMAAIVRADIAQAEVEASAEARKTTPGPWLRGDELKAALPTLKAGDVVEVEHEGHTATGELWVNGFGGLALLWGAVRFSTGELGDYVDALRIIERAPEPEPGADIPDEVVEAAADAINAVDIGQMGHREIRLAFARAALAAADAKRAELEEKA